ncbi:Gag-Pol polyprotein [Gossypium australe]|uniref:Gag-Pol polyprotein n=1 Tax=Gossypium australe TaxID=47621 RepID=A0A5B6WS87_9ROSI|nr:Gag-Pol polyprotein [Gossypium australe]
MDPDRAIADDVESNATALAQGAALSESRLVSSSHGGEAKEAFFQMMNEWFTEFVRTILAAQQPSPHLIPNQAEEFRGTIDGDPERAEFWIENTIWVFDELLCTPVECLKCAISLLRDTAYQWWNTLVSVVPRERVTWEFFQIEFRKKYISQRFLDQKHKEFLELNQGRMTVTEYEREFVRLSKYAREYVSTEEIMCKRFVDGLNEDIKLLVGNLELKEFVVLVDKACKAEELSKEKRKADSEEKDSRKRSMNKPYQSLSKESKNAFTRSNASVEYPSRDRGNQYSSPKAQATSVSSIGSVRKNKPKCQQCRK